jgi:hypothetical protein
MVSTSDSWLGIAIVLIIGFVVVGLAICTGKSIIWLFGTGQETVETSGRNRTTIKSKIHEAA